MFEGTTNNGEDNTMNASAIYSLFETAISHDLKFPKIRLRAADGQTVVLKLNGARSKYEGSICVANDAAYGASDNKYFGRIERNGAWIPGRDACSVILALLDELAANPAETAAKYGKLTGNCCFCSTPLKDARSTAVGYGPICAEHFGLPWGSPVSSVDAPNKQQTERDAMQAAFELTEANPFAGAEFADNSSPEALLNDPCTPFWAADVIRVALTKDACDAAGVFAVLAQSFNERAKKLLGQ
jgi:hypothetical protein